MSLVKPRAPIIYVKCSGVDIAFCRLVECIYSKLLSIWQLGFAAEYFYNGSSSSGASARSYFGFADGMVHRGHAACFAFPTIQPNRRRCNRIRCHSAGGVYNPRQLDRSQRLKRPVRIGLTALIDPILPGAHELMHFDHVSFGIIKEYPMPSLNCIAAPTRAQNTLRVQMCHERFDIVGAVSNMSTLKRVYHLPRSK